MGALVSETWRGIHHVPPLSAAGEEFQCDAGVMHHAEPPPPRGTLHTPTAHPEHRLCGHQDAQTSSILMPHDVTKITCAFRVHEIPKSITIKQKVEITGDLVQ